MEAKTCLEEAKSSKRDVLAKSWVSKGLTAEMDTWVKEVAKSLNLFVFWRYRSVSKVMITFLTLYAELV